MRSDYIMLLMNSKSPHNLSLITGDRVIVYANSFEILHSLVYLAVLKAVKIDLGNLF